MSITFSSGGNLGETDLSSNLKGVQKGQGNNLFANFSHLLTPESSENSDINSAPNSTNKNSTAGFEEESSKLFSKSLFESTSAGTVVDGAQDLIAPVVDNSEEDLLTASVANGIEDLFATAIIDGTEVLHVSKGVNGAEVLPAALVVSGAEALPVASAVSGAEVLPAALVVSGAEVLPVASVVNGAEVLLTTPVVIGAEVLPAASVVNDTEVLLVTSSINDAQVLPSTPVVSSHEDLFSATLVNVAGDAPLISVGRVIDGSNSFLDGASINSGIGHIGNDYGKTVAVGSEVSFNSTTAFVNSRIESLRPQVETDNSEVGLKFSTFENLVLALNVFEKTILADNSKGELTAQKFQEVVDLGFLSDLENGTSIHIELKDSNSSSIYFDIRDLKKNLKEVLLSSTNKNDITKTPVALLIPQTVPIDIEINNFTETHYDPFVAIKIELLDEEGKLGVTELFDLPGDENVDPGVNLISVTKPLEISPDVDARSTLLVGLSIPKDTDPNSLPDFVKFDVSLQNGSRNSSKAAKLFLAKEQELGHLKTTDESEVKLDFSTKVKSLIQALGEMSNASKNGEQIVTKSTSADPILKFSRDLDIRPVSLTEANSLFHKQILGINNSEFSKQNGTEVNILQQKPLTLDLIQKQIVVEKASGLFSTTKIDTWQGPITSTLNLANPEKLFNPNKNSKNLNFSNQDSMKLIEQKPDGGVFNPKSFLEAADTLRMKQIIFPSSSSQGEPMNGRQPDVMSFSINKFDNTMINKASSPADLEAQSVSGNNKISLYNAQYASRLSMLVVDKVLKGQENFEIHLEPESFGKIKVNVLLDKQAIDIRMVAETQAAASLLRANEESLLQITAQNGMKLANFAVGMQSGMEQQRQNLNQNRNRVTEKANSMLKDAKADSRQSQISYRTSTSLNLIA